MKVLIDTNVILDHLLKRDPFYRAAAQIFTETENGKITSFISATTVTTVYYLVSKVFGNKTAHSTVGELLQLFEVAPINRTVLTSALQVNFADFEDAVVHEAALHNGLSGIITRNIKDFSKSKIPVLAPEEFILTYRNLVN